MSVSSHAARTLLVRRRRRPFHGRPHAGGLRPGKAAEGEGEAAEGEAGEGEGEAEEQPELPQLSAPPSGYTATVPAGASADACSTAQWWNVGDRESETMHPGNNCIECHAQEHGPDLVVAGTVMGRFHDEDDCRGIPGVSVDIIASDGSVAGTLTTNAAGNFLAQGDLSGIAPYTVRLTFEGRTREMTTPQTSGNCMECHTQTGANGAPGRILLP